MMKFLLQFIIFIFLTNQALSAGAMQKISQIVTTGGQTTVDFTSIPQTFSHLKILVTAQDTTAASGGATVYLKVNNDGTAADYHSSGYVYTDGASLIGNFTTSTTNGAPIFFIPQASLPAAQFEVTLPGYAGTTFTKNATNYSSGSTAVMSLQFTWSSTAAVNRLTFTNTGTAFTTGSVFTLYGIQNSNTSASTAITQLAQVVTSGGQSSVDFTSISGAYSALKVVFSAQDSGAGNSSTTLSMKVNNDGTAANYNNSLLMDSINGTGGVNSFAASTSGAQIANITQGSNSFPAQGEITLVSYAGTTFTKNAGTLNTWWSSGQGPSVLMWGAFWKSTSAINRLTFITSGSGFTNGSVFTLYGIQ